MKKLASLLLIAFMCKSLPAQQVDTSQINKSLEIVVQNFPLGLGDIKGELVNKRGQTSRFQSKLIIANANETFITEQFTLGGKQLNWKCVLFRGTDVEALVKAYNDTYHQLNNSIIRSLTDKPYILTGKYKQPNASQTAVSRFHLLPSTGELKNIKVDLMLEKTNAEYMVSLQVH